MNASYCAGRETRKADKPYESNPYSRKSPAFYQWCAGWNDEDMRIRGMRYFVNDVTRLVRTDDTGKYKPTGDWREVTLAAWDAFRTETKAKKVKRK
jgi:hypothetical protein